MPPAQATIEFVFSMILVMFLAYGLIMVFRWGGVSLAERRMIHEKRLLSSIEENWGQPRCVVSNGWICLNWYTPSINEGPLNQLDPFYSRPRRMCAVFGDCK